MLKNMGSGVTNRDVADALRHVYQLMQLAGENRFRAIAFDRAAQSVDGLERPVAALLAEGSLTTVKGIGKSIAEDIRQFVEEGQMQVAEDLRARIPEGVMSWLNISGLGPKNIVKIHKELGVDTLSGLKEACADGRVAGLSGLGVKSAEKILKSIEFLEMYGERSHLDVALRVAEPLLAFLRNQSGVMRCEVAGSLRRAGETIGDVDLLCSAEKQNSAVVMDAFVGHPSVVEVLGRGETKSSVRTASGRQVDLRVVAADAFGAALLYFTGSKNHNIVLRQRARDRGMALNEYGLFQLTSDGNTDMDKLVASRTEEEIYGLLDLHYIPPELREDHERIRLFERPAPNAPAHQPEHQPEHPSAKTTKPTKHKESAKPSASSAAPETTRASLVELGDIRGVVHAHSTWSDGKYSIEEMARACIDRGYEYLVITDHSQTAAYAGGLTIDQVKKQWDEIDVINEKLAAELKTGAYIGLSLHSGADGNQPGTNSNPTPTPTPTPTPKPTPTPQKNQPAKTFTIFKGIESDILTHGDLDYPDSILEQFDLVIGSIHNGLDMPLEKMMARFENAIRHPLCKMIGHPTGRLLLKRAESRIDMNHLIELAAEHQTVIEINANPWRLDLDWRHGLKARSAGLLTSINPDAHSTDGIDTIPFGVMMGRKALFERQRVVNTKSAEEFAAWLDGSA